MPSYIAKWNIIIFFLTGACYKDFKVIIYCYYYSKLELFNFSVYYLMILGALVLRKVLLNSHLGEIRENVMGIVLIYCIK